MPVVGIISDTHGRLLASVHEAFAGVDYIIHAGDIGQPVILWELEAIAPTIAVLGNNDFSDYGSGVKPTVDTIIGGVRLFVSHYPEDAEHAARTGEYGLAVHGHTHIPRDVMFRKCRIINPGSASRPRGDSHRCAAVVTLENGVVGHLKTIEL